MALPRFLVPEIATCDRVDLSPENARHAISVLRLRRGDRLTLFNGCGLEAEAEIVECSKTRVTVVLAVTRLICRELSSKLELFVSLPKGDRQKHLVDMLVQLGVHSLTPVVCERSVAKPTVNAVERLHRVVIESSKQCGRNQLMAIRPPIALVDLIGEAHSLQGEPLRLFAHPYGSSTDLSSFFQCASNEPRRPACAVVGPEGGFSADEVQQLHDSQWCQVHLGNRILRVETAAVFISSIWAVWNECASQ